LARMAKRRTQQSSLSSQQSAAEFFSEHQQIAGFDNVSDLPPSLV
jgi:DNA topoisomerase VI subunit B